MLRNRLLASTVLAMFATALPLAAQASGGQTTPSQTSPSQGQTSPSSPGAQGPMTPSTMPESVPVRADDKKFAKDAALGGLTEVELGKLATQKASSDAVKQFGQRMVDDHTKANAQLQEAAQKDQVTVPTSLDSKHQSRIDKLAKLSGPAFDKAYMKDQVKDHQQDIQEFQNEASNGTKPDVKQFASATLPTLQEHLEAAKSAEKAAKAQGSESANTAKSNQTQGKY
jgi:putative membrane protein